MIQAMVATRILPANTRSSKRARCSLFQRANDGGPFRQVLRKRWRSFSPGTALGSPGTALGAIVAVPVNLVQRGRMLLVPRLRTLEPVLSAGAYGSVVMSFWEPVRSKREPPISALPRRTPPGSQPGGFNLCPSDTGNRIPISNFYGTVRLVV
jgi:hypothetical protein